MILICFLVFYVKYHLHVWGNFSCRIKVQLNAQIIPIKISDKKFFYSTQRKKFCFLYPQILRVPSETERFWLKTGKRDVQGSISGCACWPSRSKFFLVFSETRVNIIGYLGKIPTEGIPPVCPGPTCGQLALTLQPNPNLRV